MRDGVWVNVFLANVRMPLLSNLKHLLNKKYKLSWGLVTSTKFHKLLRVKIVAVRDGVWVSVFGANVWELLLYNLEHPLKKKKLNYPERWCLGWLLTQISWIYVNEKIIAKRDGVWVSEFGVKENELS